MSSLPPQSKKGNDSMRASNAHPAVRSWSGRRMALTVKDVAASCGVSEKTVRRWINNERLPVVRICGAGARMMTLVRPADLDQWLKEARQIVTGSKSQEPIVQIQRRRFIRRPLDK